MTTVYKSAALAAALHPVYTVFNIVCVHLLVYVINYHHNTRNGKYRICKKVRSWFNFRQWQDILLFIYASRQDLEPKSLIQ